MVTITIYWFISNTVG